SYAARVRSWRPASRSGLPRPRQGHDGPAGRGGRPAYRRPVTPRVRRRGAARTPSRTLGRPLLPFLQERTPVTPILEARGLTKRFGRTPALAGLDLVAEPGRVVALLGPNGAGKTTFIRAVATLLRPDAGSLHVAGIDALRHPARVRQVIG